MRRVVGPLCACLTFGVCEALSAPDISVAMEIACSTVTGCTSNWSKEIIGFNVNAGLCPALCYRISVTNSGTDELTNITVNHNVLGDLTAFFNFPSSFSVGEGRTLHIRDIGYCADTTNTVTAAGRKGDQTVMDHDTTVARVLPLDVRPNIFCDLFFTSPDDVDGNPFDGKVTFPPDEDLHLVTNSIIVCNGGNVGLRNVQITDPPLEAFGPACSNQIRSINFDLAVGQCRTVALCTLFIPECARPSDRVTLTSQGFTPPTNGSCVYDTNLLIVGNRECSSDFICAGIQLSRGMPLVVTATGGAQTGPQIQTPCGLLGTSAKWFAFHKDSYYPEGVAEISTIGSDYDTILTVYSGPISSPANLLRLACNDDISPSNRQSRVNFRFPPPGSGAGPYWLVVAGKAGASGSLTLVGGYEPRLESYGFISSNRFELRSSASSPPLAYKLEFVTNVGSTGSNWVKLFGTNFVTSSALTNRVLHYVDTNASQFGNRFYRIVPGSE